MKKNKKSFEEYLKEIEKIVEKLEDEDIELDTAIKYYEKGILLIEECRKILNETKLKIDLLKKKSETEFERESFKEIKNEENNYKEDITEGVIVDTEEEVEEIEEEEDDDDDKDESLF